MVVTEELADELPLEAVEEAKARAATLLLAFRHGNQIAFDHELDLLFAEHAEREVTTLLAWIAAEAVRKAYAPEVGDRVLRAMARRAPEDTGGVAVDEETASAAQLIEAVAAGEVAEVRGLVAATPDTTFLLGGLLQGVAMMLPLLPDGELAEITAELRRRHGGAAHVPEARAGV
ncbi:hypothetical protein DR950_19090 [Kitasatospora xanthocidica]|uniref:Uncharacterized protein n=1 Tax=Kitasatospora xanthocidica TaxID=83382 RepID=A0A372ZW04_9ACTN|nr:MULTISPECIES: hypothetical protein [Streptomycetaceae]OKI10977.1 hypothetical protein AMK13_00310 [Streptomyces sp. CB02056]RGD59612.1 hypothetical protein DR950_19090 [Kitasatospora xanthocidica]